MNYENLTAEQALVLLDERWYRRRKLKGRQMDILGGFLGTELMVIDGDSLVQRVLNDPLLALGRSADISFQLLHAFYAYERLISDFSTKGTNFEIVFFENDRHLTIGTGLLSPYEIASRSFVRAALKTHTQRIRPGTRSFQSISDPEWREYTRLHRPMSVCCSDGGLVDERRSAEGIFLKRGFVRGALAQGYSVIMLDTIEWKDSRIITILYESHPNREQTLGQVLQMPNADPERFVPAQVWALRDEILLRLDNLLPPLTTPALNVHTNSQAWAISAATTYLQSTDSVTDPNTLPVLFAFVVHLVLLQSLSVSDRSLPSRSLDSSLESYLIEKFYPHILPHLQAGLTEANSFRPDLDGRVFAHVLHHLISATNTDTRVLLGNALASRVDEIWAQISPNTPAATVPSLSTLFSTQADTQPSTQIIRTTRVLPFEHNTLDKYFANINAEEDPRADDAVSSSLSTAEDLLAGSMLLKDTHVWKGRTTTPAHHQLSTKDATPAHTKARMRKLRKDQRVMAQLQRQAGTLTGAKGALLQQQVIASVGNGPSKSGKVAKERPGATAQKEKAAAGGKKGKKEKEPPMKSADKLRAKIKESKEVKVQSETETWWKAQLTDLSKLPVSAQLPRLDNITRNKKVMQEDWLAAEMAVYRLHLLCTKWVEDPAREDKEVANAYRVLIVAQVKDISEMSGQTPTIRTTLSQVLTALGLSVQLPPAPSSKDNEADRSYQFKFAKLISKSKGTPVHAFFPIEEEATLWQMKYFGEHMDRSMDSQPDPRTQFDPDAWQREVLNKIDHDESMLVVAPTSAGKTFIGFYAMERVLRESDNGLLVYVAPTKALVTQIAAEVYARYKKDLDGKSCWAVHTRELQLHDAQKTQILITIPEMLSTMLLNPGLAKGWTPRIRRIIFDEIHTISENEGGAVWEQLLLMAPCPIIGLSATVGNPNEFNNWLGSIQTVHGYKHSLVRHPHRYSHLRKFVYDPDVGSDHKFTGLTKRVPGERIKFIHPISALGFRFQDIPDDLSLESRDCVSLFDAMKQAVGPEGYEEIAHLDPLVFFKEQKNSFFRQKDVLQYEAALKEKLQAWMSASNGQDADSPPQRVIKLLSESIVPEKPDADYEMPRETKQTDLVKLLSDLHHQDDLPAILFNFDRHASETLAQSLLSTLEESEEAWRETSPEWKQKLKEWERWEAGAKARERAAKSASKKSKRGGGSDDEDGGDYDDGGTDKPLPPGLTNPDDPSDQFSFASFKQYGRDELAKDISELKWSGLATWTIDCLKRGIAVHHSGMNKRYRSLIEGLFRLGFIRVMISSETLALGINAPCKTCVFLGDSPKLTALMFRQCAGRAGRRGFDLLGKVVFFGVALDKIQRLLLSRLPPLTGQYPLSTTLSLRLLNLLDGSSNAEAAVQAVTSFLEVPRLSISSESDMKETAFHMRFSLDYLRRARLLDETGKTLLLSSLASPLHENEPGNLAFVALLQSGYIHALCDKFDSNTIKTQRELVLLLSHLFSRKYMRRMGKEEIASLVKNHPQTAVDLPPLPKEAETVLRAHNERTLHVFSGYTLAFATQAVAQGVLKPDTALPLTGSIDAEPVAPSISPLVDSLRSQAIEVIGRSVFVANSGHGDDFESVEDLELTTRPGLHLNRSVIPYLQLAGMKGAEFSLNAVLYDFFVHGSDDSLVKINGIPRGEVWYILEDFFIVLTTLQTSLELLFRQGIKDASLDLLEGGANGGESYEGPELDDDLADRVEMKSEAVRKDGVSDAFPTKPSMVSDGDWNVYRAVVGVRNEFETKFKAMWA